MRVYIVLAIALGMTALLGAKLFHIQIAEGAKYEKKISRQSIRRERLPGMRGRISDRNGVCLAESRPSYCVAVYLEEVREMGSRRYTVSNTVAQVRDLLGQLSDEIGVAASVSAESITNHVLRRSPLPLIVWRDVDEKVRARLAEKSEKYPAADIYIEPVRVYTNGSLAAHVLGYVRRTRGPRSDDDDAAEPYQYYRPEMEGNFGVERIADDTLRGKAGAQLIRVDASGFKRPLPTDREEDMILDAIPGGDVMLTLDVRVQKAAEKALQGIVGAAVVLDPRNGDVLALASSPSFDPNVFVSGSGSDEVNRLLSDDNSPLLDRAVSGVYAPGSLFKLVVAAAALEKNDDTTEATTFSCPGYYSMGKQVLHCWNWQNGGHGQLDMHRAIEQSCNTYFCQLGAKCGYRSISEMARRLGLGRRTDLGLDGERAGNLPPLNVVRSKGDLANVSIGQGAIEVTALQMAGLAATMANGGYYRVPRIVMAERPAGGREFLVIPPAPARSMNWSQSTIQTIRSGMKATVHSPQGTAKRTLVEGYVMAAKTGTAEHGVTGKKRNWGWTIVFAPFDNPRYAVALVVEDAVSGGISAAPLVRQIMSEILPIKDPADEPG